MNLLILLIKDISALKTYKSICVKISATKDTTEGAVSGVGNESVTLYAKIIF